MKASQLKCYHCQASYPLTAEYVCKRCFGPLEVEYDYSDLIIDQQTLDHHELRRSIQAGPQNIWRYHHFLPATPPAPARRQSSSLGLPVGCTPLIDADRLAERLGVGRIWIKNDCANPTHSFKDRVVAVAVARAVELGFTTLACASTGNLANAVAAAASARGLDSYIFVPDNLEAEKIIASAVYGTRVVKVEGNYDDVNRLCAEIAGERDWAFVNVNLRPYYAEGSKTLAFEICEQLGFRLPDKIIAPIASGSLYSKLAKGIDEWLSLGLIDGETPQLYGVQALGCSPVAQAFNDNQDHCLPVKPATIAKSLAIGSPADGDKALAIARETGGTIGAVRDEEIRAAILLLAETTGIFTETAGGVTVAGLVKLAEQGLIGGDDEVVVLITGDGLKTIDAVRDSVATYQITPSLDQFEAEVEGLSLAG